MCQYHRNHANNEVPKTNCHTCWEEYKEFINRPSVEISFTNDEFLTLSHLAQEQDITFNELCNNILEEAIGRSKNITQGRPNKKTSKATQG